MEKTATTPAMKITKIIGSERMRYLMKKKALMATNDPIILVRSTHIKHGRKNAIVKKRYLYLLYVKNSNVRQKIRIEIKWIAFAVGYQKTPGTR